MAVAAPHTRDDLRKGQANGGNVLQGSNRVTGKLTRVELPPKAKRAKLSARQQAMIDPIKLLPILFACFDGCRIKGLVAHGQPPR